MFAGSFAEIYLRCRSSRPLKLREILNFYKQYRSSRPFLAKAPEE